MSQVVKPRLNTPGAALLARLLGAGGARAGLAKRSRRAGCADSARSSAAETGVRSMVVLAPLPSVTSIACRGASCRSKCSV